MILSQRQLDVLNHVVVDGQAWADNAKKESHVLAKVARHEADYDEAVAKGNYKNRATRDEEERVANLPIPTEEWKRAMARTDRMGMPRYLEDHIADDHGGVAGNEFLQAKFDDKKALRLEKP
jgi:hypothetical protein